METKLSDLLYGMRYNGPLFQEMYEMAIELEKDSELLKDIQDSAIEAKERE